MIGHAELLIVGAIILILFGSTALPKFFRSLGKAKSEFEQGQKEASHQKTQADGERDHGTHEDSNP